jgi:polyisoprenoid-binding protein YceI
MHSRFMALVAAAAWLAAAPVSGAAAESAVYVFDKQHTNVSFSWNRLGLSRQSGRIVDVEGTLEFDSEKPDEGRVDVRMKTTSIATLVPELDRALKGPDFFDAARHPLITFKSTQALRTGDRTGEVTGDLTILGKTNPVVLTVTWNFTGEHPLSAINAAFRDRFVAGFSARARLNRSEWGLSRGTPFVSDEIEISIETELLRK